MLVTTVKRTELSESLIAMKKSTIEVKFDNAMEGKGREGDYKRVDFKRWLQTFNNDRIPRR